MFIMTNLSKLPESKSPLPALPLPGYLSGAPNSSMRPLATIFRSGRLWAFTGTRTVERHLFAPTRKVYLDASSSKAVRTADPEAAGGGYAWSASSMCTSAVAIASAGAVRYPPALPRPASRQHHLILEASSLHTLRTPVPGQRLQGRGARISRLIAASAAQRRRSAGGVGLGKPPRATGRTNDVAAQHSCRAAVQTWALLGLLLVIPGRT